MKRYTLIAAFFLTACGKILPDAPNAPTMYVVNAPTVEVQTCNSFKPLALEVGTPQMAPGLDSERIAVRKASEINFIEGVRWAEPLPALVQSQLVETFDNTRCLKAVARDSTGLKANYRLAFEVRKFEVFYPDATSNPTVRVQMAGVLLALPQYDVVTSFVANAEENTANRTTDIIGAFDKAFGRAAQDITQKSLSSIGSH